MSESSFKRILILRVFASLIVFSLLASCSPKRISLYERLASSREYRECFWKNTKSKKVYAGLETRFIIYGTYLSPEFQKEILSELYKMYYLDESRKEAHEKYVVEKSRGKIRFFVALFTPDEKMNDLDEKEGHWSVRLVTEDEESYAPSKVEKLNFSEEEINRVFPLEDTRWFKFYDVSFELNDELREKVKGSPFKLVFLSPLGRAVLVYTPK